MSTYQHLHRVLTRTLNALAAICALSTPAWALTTYTYTAPITYWANSWGSANWGSYGGLDGSGFKFEFTTAAPLTSFGCISTNCNPGDALSQVLSWKYHGGSGFMNLGSDTVGSLTGLLLSTDASGAILNNATDRFYVHGPVVIPGLEAYQSTLSEAHDGYDQQLLASSYLRQYSTGMHSEPLYASLSEGMSNMHGAGQWSFATTYEPITSAVPEPQTYLLMLTGMALMGAIVRRRNGVVLASCLLIGAQAHAGLFDKAPQPIMLEASTDRAEAFKTLFLNENMMARDQNKPYDGPVRPLAIGTVMLRFTTDTSASSTSGSKGATVDVNYKLLGLSPETMQTVADEFAASFAMALAGRGYTVLDQEKVLAVEDFRKLVNETAGPQTSGGLVKALANNSGTSVLSKGTADVFTMAGYSKAADLAKALGATTIHANLIIGFAKLANSGSYSSAEVAHGVKLSISPQSMFMVVGADGSTKQFQFRQEIVLPSQIGAKVIDAGRTGGQTALLIFNALAGGSSGSIKNFEVTVVDTYRELVGTDLKMVGEVLAQGLKKPTD